MPLDSHKILSELDTRFVDMVSPYVLIENARFFEDPFKDKVQNTLTDLKRATLAVMETYGEEKGYQFIDSVTEYIIKSMEPHLLNEKQTSLIQELDHSLPAVINNPDIPAEMQLQNSSLKKLQIEVLRMNGYHAMRDEVYATLIILDSLIQVDWSKNNLISKLESEHLTSTLESGQVSEAKDWLQYANQRMILFYSENSQFSFCLPNINEDLLHTGAVLRNFNRSYAFAAKILEGYDVGKIRANKK